MLHHIMDEQCSPLGWSCYFQDELGFEELKQSLLYSTLELDAAVVSAHEEISRKDDEIVQLRALLAKIVEERDEFRAKCQELAREKQVLFQQVQIQECPVSSNTTTDNNADLSPSDSNDDDNNNNNNYNNITAMSDTTLSQPSPAAPQQPDAIDRIAPTKSMPEKGKFLRAVMEAGPLLQTLLLAGPLPQWQHPPPQLNSIDIPPVTIINSPKMKVLHQDSCLLSPSSGFTNKRTTVNRETLDPSPKYQKVCSPIIIDSNI